MQRSTLDEKAISWKVLQPVKPLQNQLQYSIKLSREKLSQIGERYDFSGENFHRLLTFAMPKDATPPTFVEKTFAPSHKTAKFAKVFSLESLLYSTFLRHIYLEFGHDRLLIFMCRNSSFTQSLS